MTSPFRSGRLTTFGVSLAPRPNPLAVERLVPQYGFTEAGDLNAPPGSFVSGENVWVRPGLWEPRWRYAQVGTDTPLPAVPVGSAVYDDVSGSRYPVVASDRIVAYLNGDSWDALAYVSGTSNLPPSGTENDRMFGVSVYLPRADANLLLFTNGVDPLFAWAGPSSGTGFSTLTQAPICKDVVLFDNRPVAWNLRDLSSSSQLVTRVAWTVRGDPEDWTTTTSFAGFEDLLDMRGVGTRAFVEGDALYLFSTEEVYLGRKVGPPFIFQFSPLDRTRGLPYPRAALQTSHGVFWLGADKMIYRLSRGIIEAVGAAIQRTLVTEMQSPDRSLFSWNEALAQLTLTYTTSGGAYGQRQFTLNLLNGQWTRHSLPWPVAATVQVAQTTSSATTWGGLTGTIAGQTLTYAEMLGNLGQNAVTDGLVTSAGTVYGASPSATSDGGVTPLHEIVLRSLTSDPSRRKLVTAARLEAAGQANSTLSIAFSGDLGRTIGAETLVTLPALSQSSQFVMRNTVDGAYPAIRLRSSSASTWLVTGLQVEAKVRGPVV